MKKKLIILVQFVLLTIGINTNATTSYDDIEKKEVVLVTQDKSSHYDRSSSSCTKVFLLTLSSEIEVCCSDEGNVVIYLFNSRNQMCGYAEFDSTMTASERLAVPKQSGIYHIAIITDMSYSEGCFTK